MTTMMVMTEVVEVIPLKKTDDATVTRKTMRQKTPIRRVLSHPQHNLEIFNMFLIRLVLASGRGDERMAWSNEIVTARCLDELWCVPKKCRSSNLELAVAAMTASEDIPAIYNILRREGRKVRNKMCARQTMMRLVCVRTLCISQCGTTWAQSVLRSY
jgi:hypothetical protein